MNKLIRLLILIGGYSYGYAQQQTLRLYAPPPSSVGSVSVNRYGNSGNTIYYYFVVANYPIGKSVASPAAILNGGADTLTVQNYNIVNWGLVSGATTYDVLRTTTPNIAVPCTCAVAIGLSSTTATYTNNNTTINSYTLNPASGYTATIGLDNQNYVNPRFTLDTALNVPMLGHFTVSTLPTVNPVKRYSLAVVTDGDATLTCTVGGGTTVSICLDNGTTWQTVGGGGGSGTTFTVAGTTRQITASGTCTGASGTCTLSIPVNFLFPGNFTTAVATSSYPSLNIPDGTLVSAPTFGDIVGFNLDLWRYQSGGWKGFLFSATGIASGGIPYSDGGNTVFNSIKSSAALTNHGVVIGGGVGGAPTSTSAGTAGYVLTSNGASSDPTFQASGGSSILVDVSSRGTVTLYQVAGKSCAKWTITSAQIISGRTGSTNAEDSFVTLPANAIVENYTYVTETTAFAGIGGGFSASMQVSGNSANPDLLPVCALEASSGHSCQNYPGNPSSTSSFNASVNWKSSNGSTTFNSLSAGTAVVGICVTQGQ